MLAEPVLPARYPVRLDVAYPETQSLWKALFRLCGLAVILGLLLVSFLGPAPASATGAIAIDAGTGPGIHTCAVLAGGQVWCWGDNDDGELGIGVTSDQSTRPVSVCVDSSCSNHLTGVSAIGTGGWHTCAILSDASLKCWGNNNYAQLGIGVQYGHSTIPVDVCADVSCTENLRSIAAVSGNERHTCAVTTGGALKCWGSNYYGALGDGTTSDRTAPVDVTGLTSGVARVVTAREHTCALTTGGGVKCWGDEGGGRLGNGQSGCCPNRTTPQDVVGLGSGVTAIDTLNAHTCALTSAGGVKCWGSNSNGQLGDGSSGNLRSTAIDVVGLGSGVTAIAVGGQHTCALMESGSVKCWGANDSGQLGDGSTTERDTPVDVQGLGSGVVGLTAGENHTCALLQTGGVVCWGRGGDGQLGTGDKSYHTSPTAVVDLKPTPTPTPTPTGTPTPAALHGDANADGRINSIDAAIILQFTAGLVSSLPSLSGADVDRSGSVNAIDAQLILQYVAGLIGSLPP